MNRVTKPDSQKQGSINAITNYNNGVISNWKQDTERIKPYYFQAGTSVYIEPDLTLGLTVRFIQRQRCIQ
jgi:hypothetical protein